MNYFAHGHRYVDDPYMLAGTAVPDWLSVVDRRARARSVLAAPHVDHADARIGALARGVVQHHRDDAWFHRTRAFAELSLDLTLAIRDRLDQDDGFRPSFLGHILVEILLDAVLMRQMPERLDDYYAALAATDPEVIDRGTHLMVTRPVADMPRMIELFCRDRFLYDYLDDKKLFARLNRVMRRVKLPVLPDTFRSFLPEARNAVTTRTAELLTEENGSPQGETR